MEGGLADEDRPMLKASARQALALQIYLCFTELTRVNHLLTTIMGADSSG